MIVSDCRFSSTALGVLVSRLPEVYQPIFGHPEYASMASRSCEDRLSVIRKIYLSLAEREGRPLRVLDLGCAQGFFSLSLSAIGAVVTGVDYSQENIDVCNKLAQENPLFKVEFRLDSIDTVVDNLEHGQYDLVFGLSVFHHLIYEHGLSYVRTLFDKLSLAVESGFFEFALSNEPLYWAASQPDRPRDLLGSYAFSHRLSCHVTHLSNIQRPMYFASGKYWLIDFKLGLIDEARHVSHCFENGFHKGTRTYIISDDFFVKFLRFDGDNREQNKKEYHREVSFLLSPPRDFPSPALLAYGENEEEGWVVRNFVRGRLLSDILNEDAVVLDNNVVVGDLLSQLATLESAGLFHSDVRSWNVLITSDGRARLIDFGAISEFIEDGDDRYGQILSVINTLREIVEKYFGGQNSQRPKFVSPAHFSGRFARWLKSLWLIPSYRWSFQLLNQIYIDSQSDSWSDDNSSVEFIQTSNIIESFLSTFSNKISWDLKEIERVCRQQAETRVQQAEAKAQQAEEDARHWQVRADDLHGRLLAVHASTSWRVTAPLRILKRAASRVLAPLQKK